MVLAQVCRYRRSRSHKHRKRTNRRIKKVQALLHENPLLDDSFSEILIDDSELDLSINNDWEVIKKQGGYGPTFLKSKVRNGSPVRFSPHMEHEGKYKVYTYYHMRKDISPAITYSISNGIDSWTRVIHKDSVRIEGQTTGEWIELEHTTFKKLHAIYRNIHRRYKRGGHC